MNDGSLVDDEVWGSQGPMSVGDDANDGLHPSRAKASIRSVLEAYDLDPRDVIYVNTGDYNLSTNIVLASEDSGVTIRGPASHVALLNRGNTSSGRYVFSLAGADDVTLDRLHITGAFHGVYAASGADSDRLTITSSSI